MAQSESMDRTGKLVALGVFVALVVDGMDLQVLSLALPKLTQEFGLTSVTAGALSSYTLIGMGVGGILAGWLSDRIGRVRVTFWSVVTFTVCTTTIAFCHAYWQIALMRFVSGFGLSGVYSIGTLLAAEYVPTRIRTTVLGILQAGWSIGYVVAALLASYVQPTYGWRPLFFAALLPGCMAMLLLRGVPDPPSWFAARQRARTEPGHRSEYLQIFTNPALRRMTLIWAVAAIALQFGYYGANTWLPSYLVTDLKVDLKNMGWYVAATYGMMVIGKIITGYLADVVGRKTMWVAAGLLTAAYLPVLIFTATPSNVPYLLLGFGLLYGAPYAVSATYMSESFPASVRGTAVGLSYNIGRIGSTISPTLIGFVARDYSIGLGIALLGISYAICGMVPGLFVPERMYDPKSTDGGAIDAEPSTSPSAGKLPALSKA